MALLFGGRGTQGRSLPKNTAVEFRAGKMTLKGNMVHPDKRKGQVYVYQADDQLTHFCWRDRTSGVVEDDLIIFPDDAVFSKVTQCKEGSRVFLLKFKASSRKLFFWMQEPKADKDDELIGKVNEALNNPGASSSNGGLLEGSTTPSEQEMQNLLQSMNHNQLMQLLGGMSDLEGGNAGAGLLAQLTQAAAGGGGSSTGTKSKSSSSSAKPASGKSEGNGSSSGGSTATATSASTGATSGGAGGAAAGAKGSVQLEDLQKILSGIQPSAGGAEGSVDLSAGLNAEFVKRITASPKTVKKLSPLLAQFGYEGQEKDEKEEVVESLISPAFRHALSSFCSAFPSGQLGPVMEQFEFGAEAVTAARKGDLEAFLSAVQKEADGQKQEAPEEQKPEDMNVD